MLGALRRTFSLVKVKLFQNVFFARWAQLHCTAHLICIVDHISFGCKRRKSTSYQSASPFPITVVSSVSPGNGDLLIQVDRAKGQRTDLLLCDLGGIDVDRRLAVHAPGAEGKRCVGCPVQSIHCE